VLDLPAVVIEADAPPIARPLSVLRPNEVRALAAHAEASGLRAAALPLSSKPSALPIDPERLARVLRTEKTLHDMRAPLELGDRDQLADVRARVAVAYAETRAHPEDPEAPFLASEALRTLARVEELAGDTAAGAALRARAELLDGGRRIGLSEGGPVAAPELGARVDVTFALIDAPKSSLVFVDGEPRDPTNPVALAAGEHHVRVVVDGATVAAQWVAVGTTSGQSFAFRVGATVPCSAEDLAPALASDAFSIACPRWLRVTRGSDALRVRVCGATSCGAPTVWSTAPVAAPRPIAPEESALRSKWTWIGLGAAAVIGGTLSAWQLGAFDRPDAPPPTWRWEGVR